MTIGAVSAGFQMISASTGAVAAKSSNWCQTSDRYLESLNQRQDKGR
jgi:hypothetical protein